MILVGIAKWDGLQLVKREFSAEYINSVANHPSVAHGAKIDFYRDLTSIVSDLNNVLLTYVGGGFIAINKGNGIYEAHTMALKEGRGETLREAIIEALEYLFTQTDCTRLVTTSYKSNHASVALSDHYFTRHGETEEFYYYDMTYGKWASSSAKARQEGHSFHAGIETNHDEDALHDYHVGAAILTTKAGNPMKAITQYNEWAVMSGYVPAVLLRAHPFIIGMGKEAFIFHNNTLEKISCQ